MKKTFIYNTFYAEDSAYISVSKIEPKMMDKLVAIALANEEVQTRLDNAKDSAQKNYSTMYSG